MAASSIADKHYRLMICGDCNREVAWAESSKTGKWYLCDTVEYTTPEAGHPRHRAVPYSPHYQNCQKNQDETAKFVSDAEYAETVAAWYSLEEKSYEQAGKPTGDMGRVWADSYQALYPRPTIEKAGQ